MANQPVRILCDSCVDLPSTILQQRSIFSIPMTVAFGDKSYKDGVDLTPTEFYQKLRSTTALPSTSQISPAEYSEAFRQALAGADAVVYVGLSSGLSGSMQSANIAAALPEFEGRVHVVDSLGASVGLGLMVLRAAELAASGLTASAIAADMESYRARMCHVFTLDTLEYVHRGGRVSKAAAVASRLLDVKPVLHMDMAGKLIPIDRARGRKRSLNRLFEEIERLGANPSGARVGISHADAPAEAAELAERFRTQYGAAEVIVGEIGSTIGTHTGPGCISIFFEGPEGRNR